MGFLIKEETSEQERLLVRSMRIPHPAPQRQNDNGSSIHPYHNAAAKTFSYLLFNITPILSKYSRIHKLHL